MNLPGLKTILFACVCILLIAAGSACSKEIAVIWDTKSAMPSNVASGLMAGLRQSAPDLRVVFFRELKDMEAAKKTFHECEQRFDGIVFLRSSGAEYLSTITPKVPCFVGACNNPAELGTIKNLNAPEGLITGVTYAIPYEKRFQIIKTLFPNVRSVAILIERGHPSGPLEAAGTKKECERNGIAYKEVAASNLDDLLQGTKSLGKVDLIILSNTRMVMDRVVSILPIANAMNTPIFSYADKPVAHGAVAGMAADDTKLGLMLADSVVDVIVKGRPVSQVPVKMDPEPKITINEGMMRSLGLSFPENIIKSATIIK